MTAFFTDCQQAVSGRFSPLLAPIPLRDLPLTHGQTPDEALPALHITA